MHKGNDFNTFLSTQLNEQQKEAVIQKKGSLLVIAGAGSGKTRVITARIANLILNEKAHPSSIIALTFTNKAAQEMKERIHRFLGSSTQLPFVGTFHSYCLRLLKQHSHLLRFPFLSILDQDDQLKLVGKIIERAHVGKKITAQQLLYQISHAKNNQESADSFDRLFAQLYTAYEAEKKASKVLDFDDLLTETLTMLRNHPDFKKSLQKTIDHILVDEYQDTNVIQHALLRHLSLTEKNSLAITSMCVVGDEDQSIYSWRGATVANIMNFSKEFPNTTLIKIEQNYRSVQPILAVANEVISYNKQRNPKNLWSSRTAQHRIMRLTYLSEYQEAEYSAEFLTRYKQQNPEASCALLYRAHYQSRALEEALVKYSIPYKIIGGIQFYERKEIKDILAYLRLIINPFDRSSFFRVINCPTRGFGAAFEALFYERWQQEPFLTFIQVSEKLFQEKLVTGAKKVTLEQFMHLFQGINAQEKPSVITGHIIKKIHYYEYIKKTYEGEEAQARLENIKELIEAFIHFETQGISTVALLLDEIALMQEKQTKESSKNPVILMTLHAAKGLEFDTVLITGLEDGLLPSSRSVISQAALEEERRLLYVGITRAQERLLISHCRYRYVYGSMSDQRVSRFIDELPAEHIHEQDCSRLTISQMRTCFSQWLNPDVNTKRKPTEQKVASRSPAKPLPSATTPKSTVTHAKFGVGTVLSIEQKGDIAIAQVQFKTGIKKIATQFLQKT